VPDEVTVSAKDDAGVRRPRLGHRDRLAECLPWAALAAAGLWGLAPVAYLGLKAVTAHESMTGAAGPFPADQLQYLAWIRSSGEHVLAANGFDLGTGGHVFLQPMFLISGLLWRLGMDIAVSYLLWLPVTVAVLYIGFRRFIWDTLSEPMARAVTLVLALFFVTPAVLVAWTSTGLWTIAGELAPSSGLHGYFPGSIATGLLALFMVGLDRVLDPPPETGRVRGRYLGWTTAAGALMTWLHPWEGEVALLVILGLLLLARFRRSHLRLLVPAFGMALPLLYYLLLPRIDLAWKMAYLNSPSIRPNPLLLIPALAPLVLLGAPGLVGAERWRPREQILWLWPLVALIAYFLTPAVKDAPHALEGMALPLLVLAARGWRRARLPRWFAVAAIALSTIPGLVYWFKLFHDALPYDPQALLLRADETKALAYLERTPAPGGVLASLRISAVVPAYTGRRTWIGEDTRWTPNYDGRFAAVSALFGEGLSSQAARNFLYQVGARYLLADCEPGFSVARPEPLIVKQQHFGCVAVYQLAVRDKTGAL
jgi:hypothetical protein